MKRRALLKYLSVSPIISMLPLGSVSGNSAPTTSDELYEAASALFGVVGHSHKAWEDVDGKRCIHTTYRTQSDCERNAVQEIWSKMLDQYAGGSRGIVWRVAPYYSDRLEVASDGSMEMRKMMRTRYSLFTEADDIKTAEAKHEARVKAGIGREDLNGDFKYTEGFIPSGLQ